MANNGSSYQEKLGQLRQLKEGTGNNPQEPEEIPLTSEEGKLLNDLLVNQKTFLVCSLAICCFFDSFSRSLCYGQQSWLSFERVLRIFLSRLAAFRKFE
jgi:hypothetical protein